MKSRYLLPSVVLAMTAGLATSGPARAEVVLADSVGFIQGTQIFTDTFAVTTPGVINVNLSGVSWLDNLTGLTPFLSTPSGVLKGTLNGGSESAQVQAGQVSVNWYGTAGSAGPTGTALGIGVYALNVTFTPTVTAPAVVPLPPSVPLLLSGLGALSFWARRRSALPRA